MRIAVCDDEIKYVELISDSAKSKCGTLGMQCEIDTFTSGGAILDAVKTQEYDLILLDIRMPEVNGFDVAEAIYKITKGDNLVFVTGEEKLVCQTFEFRPFGFIRKRRLDEEIDRVIDRWYDRYGRIKFETVRIEYLDKKSELKVDEIVYIYSKGHYVYVSTLDNVFKERAMLTKYDYLLEDLRFVKCNMSEICNMRYICRMDSKSVELVNDLKISLGRKFKCCAREKYNEYIKSMF